MKLWLLKFFKPKKKKPKPEPQAPKEE